MSSFTDVVAVSSDKPLDKKRHEEEENEDETSAKITATEIPTKMLATSMKQMLK